MQHRYNYDGDMLLCRGTQKKPTVGSILIIWFTTSSKPSQNSTLGKWDKLDLVNLAANKEHFLELIFKSQTTFTQNIKVVS